MACSQHAKQEAVEEGRLRFSVPPLGELDEICHA